MGNNRKLAMTTLKLGIIGLSEGNGHPYSWSAIFNGYDPAAMANCPYPVIPAYLAKQTFPQDQIQVAKVTHIWTQDEKISKEVAKAAFIPRITNDMAAMIGEVDGVLLARDDADKHFEMAKPFLEAGVPIYIDKPLALTKQEAKRLFDMQHYPGQLFTCSALQFANELQLTEEMRRKLGRIIHVEAQIKNNWNKYAIHLIEPVIKLIGHQSEIECLHTIKNAYGQMAYFKQDNGVTFNIKTFTQTPVLPIITVYGEHDVISLEFKNTFAAFKMALQAFVDGVKTKREMIKPEYTLRCIEVIERANEAA